VLQNKTVSANWYRANEIMTGYGATYKPLRYFCDGKICTSAGVTAGMDMAYGILHEVMGADYTKLVLLDMEYDPDPIFVDGNVTKAAPFVRSMMTLLYDELLKPLMNEDKRLLSVNTSSLYDELMAIMSTPPKEPVKTIGVFVYDGFNTMDAIGPYQVLAQLMSVDIFFVAKQKGLVSNQHGLQFVVNKSIEDVDQLDILVVPGGAVETFLQSKDEVVLDWIRKIDSTSVYTTSVCTGAWILGATGLLENKTVSANWYRAAEIMSIYGASYKPVRFARDGKYWTSAGVSAGMDMGFGIVHELMGENYTKLVLLDMEYDPDPIYPDGNVTKTGKKNIDMLTLMYDFVIRPKILKEKRIRRRRNFWKKIFNAFD
jgi:transcriptional regulator GlxA family with amidase domain